MQKDTEREKKIKVENANSEGCPSNNLLYGNQQEKVDSISINKYRLWRVKDSAMWCEHVCSTDGSKVGDKGHFIVT